MGGKPCLESIPFQDLEARGAAIVDATTIHAIGCPTMQAVLTTPIAKWKHPQGLKYVLELIHRQRFDCEDSDVTVTEAEQQLAHALCFLERLCLHDVIAVDNIALQTFHGKTTSLDCSDSLAHVLRTTSVPREDYVAVASTFERYALGAATGDEPSIMAHKAVHGELPDTLFDFWDKKFHDILHGESLGLPACFSQSDQTAPRALFYFELASRANCTVFLAPEKHRWFNVLRRYLQRDLFRSIEHIFSTRITQATRQTLEDQFKLSTDVRGPPLVKFIVDQTIKQSTSLLDATLAIRESPQAIAFRGLLRDLTKCLAGGTDGLRVLRQKLEELSAMADQWKIHGSGEQLQHVTRTLRLEAIPKVGWIAKLMGCESISFKDPIIAGPQYLSFVSQWYAP